MSANELPPTYQPARNYVAPGLADDPSNLAPYFERIIATARQAMGEVVTAKGRTSRERLGDALSSLAIVRRDAEIAQRLTVEVALLGGHLSQREAARALNGTLDDPTATPIGTVGQASIGRWAHDPLTHDDIPD
ncbi:hypothetical protein SAMN06295924_106130 [Rathayibacter rathayi NCPPB 2980 = VKM Ac-1601]|uniref:hypothetical protein n=1 Tax=Rathayibacter rathayi TaxID=33887 RepID=UPI000BCBEE66|nr:hypothetical protein [Rathayibacter rathayi]MWV74961.1 hypothetical protein [Rathayibacter rathayi NCPPB 2980 = VKM Ac-1601]SOE04983.1 hypothetical protein SAMN06295924_106130 [Rathayibacter rathayi NCPPB 2980 = VKM Ac-1601]